MTKYIKIDGIGEFVPRSEYDALAATVEALRIELQACQSVLHILAHDGQVTPAYANDAKKVLASTPQQHLAEVRAQAGRGGFIAGYMLCNDGSLLLKHNYKGMADKYADSIRNEMSETDYLMASQKNAERLTRSIQQAKDKK